jgi:chemotaxis protein histidine kinase CheA
MNEIRKQVKQAQRRLALGQFSWNLVWSLFFGLLLATLGLSIPKLWFLDFLKTDLNLQAWNYGWILGGAVLALLTAVFLTIRQIQSQLAVATEIDRRFKLRERLSSAISLGPEDLDSPAGKALLQDAISRAESIDVRDHFSFRPSAKALLPLVPMMLITALLFVPNATQKAVTAAGSEVIDKKQIEVMIEEAKKKKEEKRQQETKGLKDANPEIQALEKKFDKLLEDKDADKKSALVKLNDIKKQIEDRKKELGNSSELKENLNRLKDAAQGPAKELAEALGKGNMPEAQKAIRDLAKKLKEGKLNEQEAKKLTEDLNQMAKKLQELAEKKQQEKQKLEDELKKATEKGDLDKAAKLQEKIQDIEQQQQQQKKMQDMAQKLKECAECMKKGGAKGKKSSDGGSPREGGDSDQQAQAMREAAESLEEIAKQLEQMEAEMEELEDLEELDELAEGCKGCMNGGSEEKGWQDWGMGEGRGGGKRALEKNETGGFKAKVKGLLQQGQTVITGTADGDNITGRSSNEARKLIEEAISRESDPLENQVLPKAQREHAQQYFEALRKNQ